MRVVLDCQALQGLARHRGLGRYTLGWAQAFVANPAVTSAVLLLGSGNGARNSAAAIDLLRARIPGAQVQVFDAPWPWRDDGRFDVAAHRRAEAVRDRLVRELLPDVVVNCSPFELPDTSVLSAGTSEQALRVAIGYDLLPATDPACAWPKGAADIYQHRLAQFAAHDLILCISDYTAAEIRRVLGARTPQLATIWGAPGELDPAGTHSSQRPAEAPPSPAGRRGVLCTGGADPRKNQVASVRAYAGLDPEIRAAHPLVIQGTRAPREADELRDYAASLGIGPEELVLASGQLSELELDQMYRSARVVVMPSLGEGLGLPVLEAWAVGTPAIGSDTTSLGEVIADPRWSFAPEDHDRQRDLLASLLTDDGQWLAAATHGVARSQFFTWEQTAARSVDVICDALAARGAHQTGPDGPSLAAASEGGSATPPSPADAASVAPAALIEIGSGTELTRARLQSGPATLWIPDRAALAGLAGELGSAAAAFVGGGLAATDAPGDVELLDDILRSTCGVITPDPQVRADLLAARSPLPPEWVQLVPAGTPAAAAGTSLDRFAELLPPARRLSPAELAFMARNRPARAGQSIYLDVTRLRDHPGRSGIQRVSVALGRQIVAAYPGRTFTVALSGSELVLETSVIAEYLGPQRAAAVPDSIADSVVVPRPGDVLLLTEINPESERWHLALQAWRARGGRIVQMVYDLLPLDLPEFFPRGTDLWFSDWLRVFTSYADMLIGDSQSAAQSAWRWLVTNWGETAQLPQVGWIRLGHDLGNLESGQRPPREPGPPRVLVVGTIEPRKGVEAVLDAAQELLSGGTEVEFTFVGRPGWALPELIDRLRDLATTQPLVRWLDDADDVELLAEYRRADLLVMASRGEGFGLPIVEALANGVDVLARDLPVFRELLGDYPENYFRTDAQLASAIRERLTDRQPQRYAADRLVTWRESAADMLANIAYLTDDSNPLTPVGARQTALMMAAATATR